MYTKLKDIKKGDKFIFAGAVSYNDDSSSQDVSLLVVADNDAKTNKEGLVSITYDNGVREFLASPDYPVELVY